MKQKLTQPKEARLPNSYLIQIVLAIGAFAIGVTEFSPMGFLPEIVTGLDISIPKAGLLITGYALGVMVGAPIMTLWFGRFSKRVALIGLMSIFTLGNICAAIAPDFSTLMIARVITSLNHGAFFGIGSIVAISVVPQHKQASAIAMMFMGMTIANIAGVPFATWLGQNIGWRFSFLGIAGLGLITMIALFSVIPKGLNPERVNIRDELREIVKTPVILALTMTVMSAGAMFTLYTYIAPILIEMTDATPNFITQMLILIGIGFSFGNWLGGKISDQSLILSLLLFLGTVIVMMLLFPILGTTKIGVSIALLIWGMATFGLVPSLQIIVMKAAKKAPALASSFNIGAFNLGNALGAILGGFVIKVGFSYASVSMFGAILASIAMLIVLLQLWLRRGDLVDQSDLEREGT